MSSLVLTLALLGGAHGAGAAEPERRVVLVRVHGNDTVPDEEVLRLAGIAVGDALPPGVETAIEERLLASGRFRAADVRLRYRGLSESSDVAVVLVVEEESSIPSRLMAGPLLDLTDEYGFTFGGRLALVDALTEGGRVAVPLSWGGKRQAGLESSFPLGRGVAVEADISRWRRVNPSFDEPDNRLELGSGVRLRRGWSRLRARARWSDVDFAELDERFVTVGVGAALDSRRDPTVPGDAFYTGVDWRRLLFRALDGAVERPDVSQTTIDLRGYKRLVGQSLLAAQVYWARASGPMPPYEQPFLGGGQTLRGHEPGRFIGDNAALGTLELRMPLTSVTSFARAGVHAFFDTGAAYGDGVGLRKAQFEHGAGVGAFLRVAVVGIRVDWGFDLEGGNRFHVASSVKF